MSSWSFLPFKLNCFSKDASSPGDSTLVYEACIAGGPLRSLVYANIIGSRAYLAFAVFYGDSDQDGPAIDYSLISKARVAGNPLWRLSSHSTRAMLVSSLGSATLSWQMRPFNESSFDSKAIAWVSDGNCPFKKAQTNFREDEPVVFCHPAVRHRSGSIQVHPHLLISTSCWALIMRQMNCRHLDE